VVIEQRAIAVIDDVLDTANINLRGLNYPLDCVDHFIRGRVAFDLKPAAGRIDGTGEPRQLDAAGGLTDVRGTEVEALARSEHLDAIKKPAAEGLDPRDVSVTGRHEFLDQRGLIYAQVDRGGCRRALE